MSASIATTAASTAARAATRPRMAADRPAMPSLARSACLMNAAVNARGSRTPNTTARPRIWFSRVTRWPTSFLRAMISDRTGVRRQRLHMNGLEEAGAGEMRQAACIVAVGLVRRQRLQRLIGLPALDADDGQSQLAQAVVEHRRHPAGLEHDPLAGRSLCERRRDIGRRRRHLHLVR